MPSSFTEPKHAGEFIISEANGELSREKITVASGQNLVDGQLFQLSSGKAVAKDTLLNTAGSFITPIEGIIIGNHNRTSTGPDGAADEVGVAYIKRLAEVKIAAVTYPAGTPQIAEAKLELAAAGKLIIGR